MGGFWATLWRSVVVIAALVGVAFVVAGSSIIIWYLLAQWLWGIITVGGTP